MQVMQGEADERGGNEFFPEASQLDLLRDERGNLPADALRQIRAQQGRGRPRGARNKRSEKIAKWFIAQYGDPLVALGEIMNTPIDVIYEQMILAQGGEAKGKRVTGRDAMEFRKSAILDVLPYIHGKQPIAVDFNGKADAVIFIPGLNAPAGFTRDQLTDATEKLGIEAIEAAGIRLDDGTLLPDPSKWAHADDDDD
ncbi:hypothetical protein ADT71_23835 [Novosphingobium sp. ST904]|nr:hypothetical protein ADT71_23835 [Novosphingobium sp. ST904]